MAQITNRRQYFRMLLQHKAAQSLTPWLLMRCWPVWIKNSSAPKQPCTFKWSTGASLSIAPAIIQSLLRNICTVAASLVLIICSAVVHHFILPQRANCNNASQSKAAGHYFPQCCWIYPAFLFLSNKHILPRGSVLSLFLKLNRLLICWCCVHSAA